MWSSGDDVSSLAGIQSYCDGYNNDSLLFAAVNDVYYGISAATIFAAGHGRGIWIWMIPDGMNQYWY